MALSAVPEPDSPAPVIVIGCGPSGIAVVRELRKRLPSAPIKLFGAEGHQPYDRVRISSALAGELPWAALNTDAGLADDPLVCTHYGLAISAIDREAREVLDARGQRHAYAQLVIATGSRAHVPQIDGIDKANIFTFRHLDDAARLLARRVRSRHTVVLGGGLLGLEAARAMHRFHTEITVIEHAERLMPRQLDDEGAALLRLQIEALGIGVIVGDGVVRVEGARVVERVALRSHRHIDCDTLIVATGIVPHKRLALDAGLAVGRGIKVDDQLRSSDPHIYAVGECAEHRGVVYGLVAPCLEQAAVAAGAIAGERVSYRGSLTATRLKVLNVPVFSAGLTPDEAPRGALQVLRHRHSGPDRYRQLSIQRQRLVGASAIGDWAELPLVLDAVQQQRRIGIWRRWRFARTGEIWGKDQSASVADWPASTVVCNCTGVTRGRLSQAIAGGCTTRGALVQCTRASSVCGSCAPLLDELLGGNAPAQPAWGWRWLLVSAVVALLAVLMLTALPGAPYVASWTTPGWHWDELWRKSLFKQISGFTLLGLATAGLVLSLRKRWPRFGLGRFALWRQLHVLIGIALLALLLIHSGGRIGHGLNAALAIVFLALSALGAIASVPIALEHRLRPAQAKPLRMRLGWMHLLLFWPLPVLLGFHVLKTYYF